MPVTYTISHPTKLVVAVAKDQVSPADILNYLMEIHEAGAMPYRKIFDFTGARGTIPLADLRTTGQRVVAFAEAGTAGPLAIVVGSDEHSELAKLFAYAASAKRPLRIFRELHVARAWLDGFEPAANGEVG